MTTHPQQLEIAGQLLAGLMSQTLSDEPLVRQRNVCNAWASAGELIVYSQKKPPGGGSVAQSLEHALRIPSNRCAHGKPSSFGSFRQWRNGERAGRRKTCSWIQCAARSARPCTEPESAITIEPRTAGFFGFSGSAAAWEHGQAQEERK